MIAKKISLGILSALLIVSCGKKEEKKEEVVVYYPTMVVASTTAQLENEFPTTIRGKEDIQIKPRVGGFIEQVHINEGAVVKKGQLLFTINSPQSSEAVQSAKAMVSSAQSALSTAELNVVRFRGLAEKNIVSNVQLQTYENAHAAARASLAQAQSSLSQAQAMLSWTRVTSPVEGVVGELPLRQGSLVKDADVLTTVANTTDVFAYFSMNEKQLMHLLSITPGVTQAEKIKNLPPVTLILADGTTYSEKGKIETISGLIDVNTGSVEFRAEFPNDGGILRSGTSGKVIMPSVVNDVFVIPQKATISQLDRILVYKVVGDSVIQTAVSVENMPKGQDYAVTKGLESGDRIVIDGVATLKNKMKIKLEK